MASSPDGRTVLTGGRDSGARLWDVSNPEKPRLVKTLTGHDNGVSALAFDAAAVSEIDPEQGISLPGWDSSYKPEQLRAVLDEYKHVGEEALWEHLEHFLRRIIPVAEEVGVKDQVIGMLVMPLVADVVPDVVQQRRVGEKTAVVRNTPQPLTE